MTPTLTHSKTDCHQTDPKSDTIRAERNDRQETPTGFGFAHAPRISSARSLYFTRQNDLGGKFRKIATNREEFSCTTGLAATKVSVCRSIRFDPRSRIPAHGNPSSKVTNGTPIATIEAPRNRRTGVLIARKRVPISAEMDSKRGSAYPNSTVSVPELDRQRTRIRQVVYPNSTGDVPKLGDSGTKNRATVPEIIADEQFLGGVRIP